MLWLLLCILTGFKNSTLTSLYIFQKTLKVNILCFDNVVMSKLIVANRKHSSKSVTYIRIYLTYVTEQILTWRLSLGEHWDWTAIFMEKKRYIMRSLLAWLRALHLENIDLKRNGKLSKIGFLLFSKTRARELNGTSLISLATHNAKGEKREI